jgi:hypothetical protein
MAGNVVHGSIGGVPGSGIGGRVLGASTGMITGGT